MNSSKSWSIPWKKRKHWVHWMLKLLLIRLLMEILIARWASLTLLRWKLVKSFKKLIMMDWSNRLSVRIKRRFQKLKIKKRRDQRKVRKVGQLCFWWVKSWNLLIIKEIHQWLNRKLGKSLIWYNNEFWKVYLHF